MKTKTKALALIFAAVMLCSALFSCGGNMTEESAKEILEELLPKSYEFNDIFWGKGLDIVANPTSDAYQPVESDAYKSTKDMLNAASEVFSSEYIESIRSSVFASNEEGGIRARYIDVAGVLKKDTTNEGFDNFDSVNGKIDISSVKILKQNRHTALLSLSYTDGGETELTLVLENGKWLLNSPTY